MRCFVSFPAWRGRLRRSAHRGVLRTRRGGIGGPILIAALCVFEIANAPSWPRDTVGDWISKTGFAVVALAGLLVAVSVTLATRSARHPAMPAPLAGLRHEDPLKQSSKASGENDPTHATTRRRRSPSVRVPQGRPSRAQRPTTKVPPRPRRVTRGRRTRRRVR